MVEPRWVSNTMALPHRSACICDIAAVRVHYCTRSVKRIHRLLAYVPCEFIFTKSNANNSHVHKRIAIIRSMANLQGVTDVIFFFM